jgi:hypothetical protein
MAVPSVVYYHPKHQKYGWLVGKFEQDTLKDHQEQFLKGKLPLRKLMNTPLQIKDIDCPMQQPEIVPEDAYDSDLDAEILAEILAEQREREAALEADGDD